MLPGSLVAVALLLSLVPGWLFLRLTEKVRRPRHQSQLQETLEMVSVGVATTGAAILLAALVRSDGLYLLDIPPENGKDIRELAWSVLLIFATALAASAGVAFLARKLAPAAESSLVTSVWWEALKAQRVPIGKLPYLLVTLNDEEGTVVEGVLDAFTWQSDSAHYRDIALRKPIKFPTGRNAAGKMTYRNPPYDLFVIAGTDIKQIALMYVDKGS